MVKFKVGDQVRFADTLDNVQYCRHYALPDRFVVTWVNEQTIGWGDGSNAMGAVMESTTIYRLELDMGPW